MRSLVEHPVTVAEIIDLLTALAHDSEQLGLVGDMTPTLLRAAIDIIKSTQPAPSGEPPDTIQTWAIYERPKDYPDGYIARLFVVHRGGIGVRDITFRGQTLEAVRAQLPPGLTRLDRAPTDPPQIVETWI